MMSALQVYLLNNINIVDINKGFEANIFTDTENYYRNQMWVGL